VLFGFGELLVVYWIQKYLLFIWKEKIFDVDFYQVKIQFFQALIWGQNN
jgi:hypothetical protein